MKTFGWCALTRVLILAFAVALPLVAAAQGLKQPVGPVILTVTGKIDNKNSADSAVFDAAMIDAMTVSQIKTATPWRKGVATFAGPTLKSLLMLVGAKGQTLRMSALDNYEVFVPISDADQFNPVLARQIDGVALHVRDHGPLFMVYPFDERPALQSDVYYGRSIWHLTKIVVE